MSTTPTPTIIHPVRRKQMWRYEATIDGTVLYRGHVLVEGLNRGSFGSGVPEAEVEFYHDNGFFTRNGIPIPLFLERAKLLGYVGCEPDGRLRGCVGLAWKARP